MAQKNEIVESIIDRRKNEPGALVAILQDIQEIYNYLPRETLEAVSENGKKFALAGVEESCRFYLTL